MQNILELLFFNHSQLLIHIQRNFLVIVQRLKQVLIFLCIIILFFFDDSISFFFRAEGFLFWRGLVHFSIVKSINYICRKILRFKNIKNVQVFCIRPSMNLNKFWDKLSQMLLQYILKLIKCFIFLNWLIYFPFWMRSILNAIAQWLNL